MTYRLIDIAGQNRPMLDIVGSLKTPWESLNGRRKSPSFGGNAPAQVIYKSAQDSTTVADTE